MKPKSCGSLATPGELGKCLNTQFQQDRLLPDPDPVPRGAGLKALSPWPRARGRLAAAGWPWQLRCL